MKILLIEDEQTHCEKYMNCVEYLPYTIALSVAYGCEQGIKLVQDVRPDVILLDLELHESDGDGISFLNLLKKYRIEPFPYIIVITVNDSRRTHRTIRQCGADYIFTKTKIDYSPRLVLDTAHSYFIHRDDNNKSDYSVSNVKCFKREIICEIEKIGITNGLNGRNYIIEAVLTILHLYENKIQSSSIDLNKQVYPIIARKYKKSDKSIDQGIRNAIRRAWTTTNIETLAENYTVAVSYNTGYPENRDFLFYYADKIDMEIAGHG